MLDSEEGGEGGGEGAGRRHCVWGGLRLYYGGGIEKGKKLLLSVWYEKEHILGHRER